MVAFLSGCSFTEISGFSYEPNRSRYTDAQKAYIMSTNYSDTTPYNGNMSVSAPNPQIFKWDAKGVKDFTVSFYRDEELKDLAVTYVTKEKQLEFYNSELGTHYYVTIGGKDLEPLTIEYECIESGPRNLYIEGVENVRDLGGWTNKIKQGMIYRSGRFNDDKETTPKASILDSGLYEVKNHLKIKTEIDLRRTSTNEVGGLTNKSVLGDDVNYVQLPMYYGGNNILTFTGKASNDTYEYNNPAMIKQFFEILADSNNYPIDFHCPIGKDRTGCLAYLVEALLGFNEECLYRDYMFTNFANAGMCKVTDISERYGATLSAYEGTSLANKTYKYLNEVVGVSTANLDSVISILSR